MVYHAIAKARRLMAADVGGHEEKYDMGPNLEQCCGGMVQLRYAPPDRPADQEVTQSLNSGLTPSQPLGDLWIWGAGHVGRAVIRVLAPTKAFRLTWIDSALERFPSAMPATVNMVPTADMPRLAVHAPKKALHLIFTYAHDIDLALSAALLKQEFAFCGLIGSATKWQRFQRRLREMELNPNRITCPIGDPAQGKHPDQIAQTTATQLLRFAQPLADTAPTEFLVP